MAWGMIYALGSGRVNGFVKTKNSGEKTKVPVSE
jgi:hypothetical protein